MEAVKEIIYARNGVTVDLGVCVETSIVNAHPHGPVFLRDKQQWVAIRACAFSNPALREKLVYLFFAFREFKWAHSVEPVLGDGSILVLQPDFELQVALLGRACGFRKHFRI